RVGDAGCHLAAAGEPRRNPDVAFELLYLRDVLKRKQEPGLSTRYLQVRRAQPDLDLGARIARLEPQVDALRRGAARRALELVEEEIGRASCREGSEASGGGEATQ